MVCSTNKSLVYVSLFLLLYTAKHSSGKLHNFMAFYFTAILIRNNVAIKINKMLLLKIFHEWSFLSQPQKFFHSTVFPYMVYKIVTLINHTEIVSF